MEGSKPQAPQPMLILIAQIPKSNSKEPEQPHEYYDEVALPTPLTVKGVEAAGQQVVQNLVELLQERGILPPYPSSREEA